MKPALDYSLPTPAEIIAQLIAERRSGPPSAPPPPTPGEMIAQRGKTHGDFAVTAALAAQIQSAMSAPAHKLDAAQRHALDMIAVKIARILSGDPAWPDHWHDIAGYAMLGAAAI